MTVDQQELSEVETILTRLLSDQYGIRGTLSKLPGHNDNFLIVESDGRRYVYKLANVDESTDFLELEQLTVETLASADLGLNLPLHVRTKSGMIESVSSGLGGGPTIRGRLLEFTDSKTWREAGAATDGQRLDLGRRLAQITSVLATIKHPAVQRTHRWDLTKASALHKSVKLVKSASRRALLEQTFLLYNAGALPFLDALPHSLIHSDLNDENLLVAEGRISGILDFGDCLSNPTICELAIALAYVLLDEPDPFTAGAQILARYHELRPLQVSELEVLFPLICGRLAVSLTVAAEHRLIDPDRSDWFLTEDRAWKALEYYMTVDPLTAARQLSSGTGLEVFPDNTGDIPHEELLKQRQFYFSNVLSLSYDEPLTFVRGVGLFIGVELVRDHTTLEPATTEATALINKLRMRGVLTSTDGLYRNVIKIKPPLVITETNAEMAVAIFDDALLQV